MATWTMHFRIEKLSSHRVDVVDSSNNGLLFFARTSNSDITGYKELVYNSQGTSQTDYTANVTASMTLPYTEIAIEEWAGDPNDFQNNAFDGTRNWYYTGWWSGGGGPLTPLIHKLICKVYRREDDGQEHEITSFSKSVGTTETQYTTPVTVDEEFFLYDRLVVKWIAAFQGKGLGGS